jgi:hypothetical protein
MIHSQSNIPRNRSKTSECVGYFLSLKPWLKPVAWAWLDPGFGFGFRFPKPGPDEAKLKPRSPGQAKPEQYYAFSRVHRPYSIPSHRAEDYFGCRNQKTSGNASKRVIPVIAFQNAPELSAVALDIVVQRQCVLLSEDRWKEEM